MKKLTKTDIDKLLKDLESAFPQPTNKEENVQYTLEELRLLLKNQIGSTNSAKYKRSAHLTDQILKYDYPGDKQPSLFDELKDDTIQDMEIAGIERTQIVEGIKLSPSEVKIIDALCKINHNLSQNSKPKENDYYSGNGIGKLVPYGDLGNEIVPEIIVPLYNITREYIGIDKKVGGKDLDNVREILTNLNNKKFLIKHTETIKGKKGEYIKKEYEAFRPLIEIDTAIFSAGVNDIEKYRKKSIVILLHPIFKRQIDSKFILYPNDITKRTAIAHGSNNISDATIRLRDYLMRELSNKRYNPQINLEKLYYLLAEKWMRESRKKKVKEYTDKAIEAMINLGILIKITQETNVAGEPKIIFNLNSKWK